MAPLIRVNQPYWRYSCDAIGERGNRGSCSTNVSATVAVIGAPEWRQQTRATTSRITVGYWRVVTAICFRVRLCVNRSTRRWWAKVAAIICDVRLTGWSWSLSPSPGQTPLAQPVTSWVRRYSWCRYGERRSSPGLLILIVPLGYRQRKNRFLPLNQTSCFPAALFQTHATFDRTHQT